MKGAGEEQNCDDAISIQDLPPEVVTKPTHRPSDATQPVRDFWAGEQARWRKMRGVRPGLPANSETWKTARTRRGKSLPKYLSSDHDPLYRFPQWQANLRVLEVTEIKTAPYVPLSHPFVERRLGCFGASTSSGSYSGRPWIWMQNEPSSNITITGIERMTGWKAACQNQVLTGRHRPSISNPTAGEDIVEGCIRLQSPHDL